MMIQTHLQTLGHILLGQAPSLTGAPPIPATASENDARARLQAELSAEFARRRLGVDLCERDAQGFVESDDFLLMTLPYVAKTALLMTVTGMMAAPPVGASVVLWQVVAAALSTTIDEGVDSIAEQIAKEAEAEREDKVWQIFHAQRQALIELEKIAGAALHNNFSATYASFGTSAAANAVCEQFRLELEDRARRAYMDQYFESAGGFAAALAQERLGLFDPANLEQQSSEERLGTDVFIRKPWPGPNTKNCKGVVYMEILGAKNINNEIQVHPETGELVGDFPADWEPHYYLTAIPEGVWLGGLPEAMLNRLLTRKLAEWRLPMDISRIGPYGFCRNELGVMRVGGLDADASRRIYESVIKPALMRMP